MRSINDDLWSLPGMAPVLWEALHDIDVTTVSRLRELGAAGVYKLLRRRFPLRTFPYNYYLFGVEACLTGDVWDGVPHARRMELVREVERPAEFEDPASGVEWIRLPRKGNKFVQDPLAGKRFELPSLDAPMPIDHEW